MTSSIAWEDPWERKGVDCSLTKWIQQRVTQLLGVEDDVVSEMVINFLRQVRQSLTLRALIAQGRPLVYCCVKHSSPITVVASERPFSQPPFRGPRRGACEHSSHPLRVACISPCVLLASGRAPPSFHHLIRAQPHCGGVVNRNQSPASNQLEAATACAPCGIGSGH